MNTLELCDLTLEQKIKKVLFFGIKGEGEYKRWHNNSQLTIHCLYKDGFKNGEYKHWCKLAASESRQFPA
jgi:antitoxin component YwqK of YwqJK toxin-antitoxin module